MLRWIPAVCLPLVEQIMFISLQIADQIDCKLVGWTNKTFVRAPLNSCCFLASDWSSPYGIPQAWLTFGHVPLNSIFLTFGLFSFHAFTYKLLDGLTLNLVDERIVGLPRPDNLLVPLCWAPTISWPLNGEEVSGYLSCSSSSLYPTKY